MQKIGVSETILALVILFLAILPQVGFGQVPTPSGEAILCNDPEWNGEGTCIDPSVPECDEGIDDVCYTADGDLKNLENQPYCDEVSDYSGGCWDRKDYDQDTGLYPCKDGSEVEDWRDCDDGGDNGGRDGNNEEGCDEYDDYCDESQGCQIRYRLC